MNLTTNQITFLRNIPSLIKVDKTSGWKHHYFDHIAEISTFIKLIGDDKVYLLIPFINTFESPSKPRLRLSDPFLVINKSNSVLIINFIIDQWESSGFNNNSGTPITVSFEYKRIWLSEG